MADTVLRSVAIRNWTTVRESVIEFPERGLVLVRGINSASKGKMASIGSGKTALGEAISRALFGVKGRYTQLGHYSTHGKGNSYVVVNCLHKGKALEVQMGFKCPELSTTGEGLKFKYDGVETCRSHLDETRSDLVKIVTVPPDLAGWTVHLDGDMLKFSDLSESRSVELLMAALMQPRWNAYQRTTSDKANDLKRQLTNDRQAAETAKSAVTEAEVDLQTAQAHHHEAKKVYDQAVKQAKAQLQEITELIAGITARATKRYARLKEIKLEIEQRIASTAEKEKRLEIVVNEKQDALDTVNEALSDLRSAEAVVRRDLEHANQHLAQAKKTPASCPTCGKDWDRAANALQESNDEVAKAQNLYAVAAKATKTKVAAQQKAALALDAARQKMEEAKAEAPVSELSAEYEDLEGELEPDQEVLSDAQQDKIRIEQGPDKTEITRFETQIREREKQLAKNKKAVETAAAKVVEGEELLRVVEYWQEAFGPTGIPNMILGDALGPLNSTSRRISAIMSGGTLDVSYATSRQLAKGGDKAELTINVRNELGSSRAEGSSKGEGGLSNLIIAETLAEVGGVAHRIGYRWYDEILANQDEVVRRSFLSYLHNLAAEQGILIFIVSHAPEAANYADYVLVAEKAQNGTTYRWD